MTIADVLLDPTAGRDVSQLARARAPRLRRDDRPTVALLDISKPRGDVYLARIEELLAEQGLASVRYRKAGYARVADVDLRREIAARCHAVIEALAD